MDVPTGGEASARIARTGIPTKNLQKNQDTKNQQEPGHPRTSKNQDTHNLYRLIRQSRQRSSGEQKFVGIRAGQIVPRTLVPSSRFR